MTGQNDALLAIWNSDTPTCNPRSSLGGPRLTCCMRPWRFYLLRAVVSKFDYNITNYDQGHDCRVRDAKHHAVSTDSRQQQHRWISVCVRGNFGWNSIYHYRTLFNEYILLYQGWDPVTRVSCPHRLFLARIIAFVYDIWRNTYQLMPIQRYLILCKWLTLFEHLRELQTKTRNAILKL